MPRRRGREMLGRARLADAAAGHHPTTEEADTMAFQVQPSAGSTPAPADEYFRITDRVPGQVWYWAALGSILASAGLRLAGKRHWSTFVGQWPPTFLLFGLFHKLVGPK